MTRSPMPLTCRAGQSSLDCIARERNSGSASGRMRTGESMPSPCDPILIAAYHDGELDAAARANVEAHLLTCATCAAELSRLREMSHAIAAETATIELRADERSRLHDAIDDESAAPVWR